MVTCSIITHTWIIEFDKKYNRKQNNKAQRERQLIRRLFWVFIKESLHLAYFKQLKGDELYIGPFTIQMVQSNPFRISIFFLAHYLLFTVFDKARLVV